MRTLYCLIFALIVSTLTIFLIGCGIEQGVYDVSPEDGVYYRESAYGPYYDPGPGVRAYDYDTSYDPWTMDVYYFYSSPVSAGRSSGSSSVGGTRSEDSQATVKGRDLTSVHQSRAPSDERARVRRDRSALRERIKTDSESSSSSITNQKIRRDVNEGQQTQKTRRERVRSSKAGGEDEDKSKKAPQN